MSVKVKKTTHPMEETNFKTIPCPRGSSLLNYKLFNKEIPLPTELNTKNRHQNIACLLAILAFALLASRPLFSREIFSFADSQAALIRLVSLVQLWHDGAPAARWLPDINFGYGYPVFNYYPPLFYYLEGLIFLLVRDFSLTQNIALILTVFLSGAGMYSLTRGYFGRAGALLSAVAYMYAPYFLLNLYQCNAFSTMLASALMPFLIQQADRLIRKPRPGAFLGTTLCLAGLILAHTLSFIMFLPAFAAYCLWRLATLKERKLPRFALLTASGLCALGTSACFWMPAVLELKFVTNQNLYLGIFDFRQNFLTLTQLIFHPWELNQAFHDQYGPTFQLGPAHILLALAGIAAVLWRRKAVPATTGVCVFWTCFMVLSAVMTLNISRPAWDAIPILKYLQFPTRFFLMTSFSMALLAGGVTAAVNGKTKWAITAAAAAFILALNLGFTKPLLPMRAFPITSRHDFLYYTRPMDSMGFLPTGVKRVPMAPPAHPFEAVNSTAQISILPDDRSLSRHISVSATAPAVICYHQFFFPGWRATLDNEPTALACNNPWGVITVTVPPGKHDVRFFFGQTPLRITAMVISWITLLGMTTGAFFWRRKIRAR